MRRYIPALLLVLTAFAAAPLAGCGDLIAKLKGGSADAAADAAVVEAVVDAAPAPEVVDAAPASTLTPAHTAAKVAVKTDAGVTDAGADAHVAVDASAAIADASAQLADAASKLLPQFDGGRLIIPKGLLRGK